MSATFVKHFHTSTLVSRHVAEASQTLKEVSSNPALINLAIAGGSAKVEHYEVVAYRALVAGAEAMGQAKVMKLLQRNLAQEEATATKVEASLPKLLQQAISHQASGAASSKGASTTKSVVSKQGATSTKKSATGSGTSETTANNQDSAVGVAADNDGSM